MASYIGNYQIPVRVKHWDDERNLNNGIIITLHWGWSFDGTEHQGVRGFDTITEAKNAVKSNNIFPCSCPACVKGKISEPQRTALEKAAITRTCGKLKAAMRNVEYQKKALEEMGITKDEIEQLVNGDLSRWMVADNNQLKKK